MSFNGHTNSIIGCHQLDLWPLYTVVTVSKLQDIKYLLLWWQKVKLFSNSHLNYDLL